MIPALRNSHTGMSEHRLNLELQAGRLASSLGHSWTWIKKASESRLLDYLENPIYCVLVGFRAWQTPKICRAIG